MSTTKQLRHCSAVVHTYDKGFTNSHELVSYSTPVALLGMVDGEFTDAWCEIHEHHGMALFVGEYYDCSVTTMSHVRKFLEDYAGIRVTITDIRKALKTDNVLYHVYGGDIMVYRCDW